MLLGAGAEPLCELIFDDFNHWQLCNCSHDVIQTLNDPELFFQGLKSLDIDFPATQLAKPANLSGWLFKQVNSCGGMGVMRCSADISDTNYHGYYQEEISGKPISVLCISAGQSFQLLGVNEQYCLIQNDVYPYVYHGALANLKIDSKNVEILNSYIVKIINYFNLFGVFSIDMIETDESVYVLEINPRISASYELYEYINPDLNLVDAHIRVCEGERLSTLALSDQSPAYRIVYASDDLEIATDIDWPEWSKDIPESGRQVLAGEPICSVYAHESEGALLMQLDAREKSIISIIKQ